MRIALIQPAKPDDKSAAAKDWSLCRPLSLLYLSCAISKSQLHESEIFDLELLFASQNDFNVEKFITSLDFDVFGITSTTFTRHEAAAVVKLIRKHHPGKKVIVGGVHFTHCDLDTLANIPEVDIVVRGEGEKTIVELLNALETSAPLENVNGISFRAVCGEIRRNPDADIFEDLDSLDIYNVKSPKDYPEFLMGSNDPIPAMSVMTSRGCPYKCVFCAKAGVKYRHRSYQNVIQELKYYIEEYGITSFNFLDLTFTANPQRSKELCQAIIDAGLEIQWWCETRANVPLELVTLMYKAGCRYIVVGVETGSVSVLERIQKGVTLHQVEALFSHTKKLGLDTTGYFVCSHIGETYEDAIKTLKFINKVERMYGVSSALQVCMILPGTEIENVAKATGSLPELFSWADDYENPHNAVLGQVTTIPLFFDRLTREQVADLLAKLRTMRQLRSRYKKLSFDYLKIALRVYGPTKLLQMVLDDLRAAIFFR
ncbi:MAG: radical SAM protein [Desulfuromonadaceae bacterium]|nr:radical SAM protein [Desulfuromonadaceae bacterium]